MITKGLLLRLNVRPGMDGEVERFLSSLVPLVSSEGAAIAWLAVRFGRGDYGIVDVFVDEAGRDAHLQGRVTAELTGPSDELFEAAAVMRRFDVLGSELPDGPGSAASIAKGVLMLMDAKEGKEAAASALLERAGAIVADEAGTVTWFAVRFDDGQLGTFATFANAGDRFTHLAGGLPRELVKPSVDALAGFPDLEMVDVVAASFASPSGVRTL